MELTGVKVGTKIRPFYCFNKVIYQYIVGNQIIVFLHEFIGPCRTDWFLWKNQVVSYGLGFYSKS